MLNTPVTAKLHPPGGRLVTVNGENVGVLDAFVKSKPFAARGRG